jgi:hypothetical protein
MLSNSNAICTPFHIYVIIRHIAEEKRGYRDRSAFPTQPKYANAGNVTTNGHKCTQSVVDDDHLMTRVTRPVATVLPDSLTLKRSPL